MRLITLATALLASASLATAARAALVDFDDTNPSGTNEIQTHFESDGFNFDGGHFHIIDDNSAAQFVDDGAQYLTAEAAAGLGRDVTMTRIGGGVFDLNQIDIGELWLPGNPNNSFFAVVFHGVNAGGVLDRTVELDGIRDGAGGEPDFQSVIFSGWTDLTSLNITGVNAAGAFGDYSIDNIVVDGGGGVPEPTSWALMLLGFAGLGATLRARRRVAAAALT